jgi:acetyltransferase-like isoleucine patch superfamily enzyme
MRALYHLFIKASNWPGLIIRRFFYFIYPNFGSLIRHRIKFKKMPAIHQFTLCEGAGHVEFGANCTLGYKMGGFHRGGSIEFQARYPNSRIKIGNDVATNNNLMVCAANYIEIGDHSLIGQFVTIMDHDAHGISPDKRREVGEIGQVIIGRNAWLGNNVIIMKNTEIGENSIVAAGAVVAGKFPPNVIVGGVPAKIIKNL